MDPPFGDDGPGRGGDEMPASRREAQSYGTPRTAVALPRDRELDAHRRAPVDFISWNTDRVRAVSHHARPHATSFPLRAPSMLRSNNPDAPGDRSLRRIAGGNSIASSIARVVVSHKKKERIRWARNTKS
jgi:hypothetical protein